MTDAAGSAPTPKPRRRKPLSAGKKLTFGLVTVCTLLGLTECGFRIREDVRRGRRQKISPRIPDTYRNQVLEPSVHFEEEGLTVDVNSLGMRDREVPTEKAAGGFRILCVGGSTTYGLFTTSNDKTWPAQLQVALQQAGYPEVEVYNGGVPAWDLRTSQTNLELRLYEAVQPDLVICYHAYNDLIANFDPSYEASSHAEDVSELWQPQRASALFRFLARRLHDPREMLENKRDAITEAGTAAYERNLRRFVRRTREEGAQPFFCTYPSALRPTLAESEEVGVPGLKRWFGEMSPFAYPALVGGITRYNEVIRSVSADVGVGFAEVAERMPHDVKYYTSTVHHSDEGEALVAGIVAEALLKSGLLPTR